MKIAIYKVISPGRAAMILVAVVVGFCIGYWSKSTGSGTVKGQPHDAARMDKIIHSGQEKAGLSSTDDTEEALYICPMNCVPPMEQPGTCPVCGMDLVAVVAKEHRHEEGPARITVPEDAARTAGIRVAPVERKFVTAEVRLFGRIEYDPVEQYRVTAFAPGVIDRIYVKRAGQTVRRGDPLFDMHSSELYFLEEEMFEILKKFPTDTVDYRPARGQRYRRLMRPARRSLGPAKDDDLSEAEKAELAAAQTQLEQVHRKMMLLGLSKTDIENVMARGRPSGISTVTTPTTGVVLEQFAFKGTYVNTGETIFTVANPKNIWARLDAYESDLPWIRIGQTAEFETDSFPGEIYTGKVLYLDPYFDPKTRTFRVGVLYTDPHTQLKPNMLVRCVIHARMTAGGVGAPNPRPDETAPLVVPESAPLLTGKRAVVYVETPDEPGTFEAREVMLGPRARGYYVVKDGLREGETVVVNGNFKIDSAVQILAKSSMMSQPGSRMSGHQPEGGLPVMHMKEALPEGASMPGMNRRGPQHRMYGGGPYEADPRGTDHSGMHAPETGHSGAGHSNMDHSNMAPADGRE